MCSRLHPFIRSSIRCGATEPGLGADVGVMEKALMLPRLCRQMLKLGSYGPGSQAEGRGSRHRTLRRLQREAGKRLWKSEREDIRNHGGDGDPQQDRAGHPSPGCEL